MIENPFSVEDGLQICFVFWIPGENCFVCALVEWEFVLVWSSSKASCDGLTEGLSDSPPTITKRNELHVLEKLSFVLK